MIAVMSKEPSAKSLIARAQRGDRQAFDELAAGHRDRLLAFIYTRLGPDLRQRVEPEDILQDALLRAYESIQRFEWRGPASVFSWLAGIAEFRIRDLSRAARRRPQLHLEIDPADDGVSPSRHHRREERLDRLEQALESLTDDHKKVIRLARIEKLPVSEIANRMGRTPSAIRHLLLRAMEKLRESFGEETESFHLPAPGLEEGRKDAES